MRRISRLYYLVKHILIARWWANWYWNEAWDWYQEDFTLEIGAVVWRDRALCYEEEYCGWANARKVVDPFYAQDRVKALQL